MTLHIGVLLVKYSFNTFATYEPLKHQTCNSKMTSAKKTNTSSCKGKPEIYYPCIWQYKVIGQDQDMIKEAIKEICAPVPVAITYSHSSSNGKYHSFNAELEIQDEKARIAIYHALQNHSAIKVVL